MASISDISALWKGGVEDGVKTTFGMKKRKIFEQRNMKNMDNEFFNFDKVIEIEKQKSYIEEIRAEERKKVLEKVRDLTFREVTYTDSLNDRTEFRELLDKLY